MFVPAPKSSLNKDIKLLNEKIAKELSAHWPSLRKKVQDYGAGAYNDPDSLIYIGFYDTFLHKLNQIIVEIDNTLAKHDIDSEHSYIELRKLHKHYELFCAHHALKYKEALRLTADQLLAYKNIIGSRCVLLDLKDVGPDKPLGYLPLPAINEKLSDESEKVKLYDELRQKGLVQKIVENAYNQKGSFFCYFYHSESLSRLLQSEKNQRILNDHNIPCTPDGFIQWISMNSADRCTPLFDLIADAFADYSNTGRTQLNLEHLLPSHPILTNKNSTAIESENSNNNMDLFN